MVTNSTGFFDKPNDSDCENCKLYTRVNSPKMIPFGNFKRGIMNIGEAPGITEDQKGRPWQGVTGKLLSRTYRSLGIDLFEDCININAVCCHPTDDNGFNRTPSGKEIMHCHHKVFENIQKYKPKVIVLFGASALSSVVGSRWKNDLGSISKWRGFTIPDQDLKAWICPTYHPSFVSREDAMIVNNIWEDDLKEAIKLVDIPIPENTNPRINYIEDLSILSNIKSELITIDYETTGLKPQAPGHRILCAAIAIDKNTAYTFMIPPTKQLRYPLLKLLENPTIGKIAHNIKFEDRWSETRLYQTVNNWKFDTMLASHILDNRQGVTGLKFQTYVNFGVVDYASEVSPFLKAKNASDGNALNKLPELIQKPDGTHLLLTYCAWDAIWEYRLAMKQMELIGYDLPF
jgi:uracil-DNA glycosylase family 4